MNKLEKYGIRGIAHKWINNYLGNRHQYVQIHNNKPDLLQVACGLPQGSVLGPKLFILYINDICNVSKFLNFVLFADDTNLFCSGKNLERLLDTVEMEIDILKCWFSINKLSVNVNKTKYVISGNHKVNKKVQIMIDKIEIERVYKNKFLGVVIDHKRCWKPHIDYIKKKISKSIAILYKAKEILNSSV